MTNASKQVDMVATRQFKTSRLAKQTSQRSGKKFVVVVCGLTGRSLAVFTEAKLATKFIKRMVAVGESVCIPSFPLDVLESGIIAEEMMAAGKTGCIWKR